MSTYESRMLERKKRFVERWLVRLQATSSKLDVLETATQDYDLLQEISKDFHQICGAAGIYKLPAVCLNGVAAEDLCLELLRSRMLTARHVQELKKHHRLMMQELLELSNA